MGMTVWYGFVSVQKMLPKGFMKVGEYCYFRKLKKNSQVKLKPNHSTNSRMF